jgi:hypothetical protein
VPARAFDDRVTAAATPRSRSRYGPDEECRPVATSDVISAVSETLEARLTAGLGTLGPPAPRAQLHDLVTPVTGDPPTVTLFLYDIVEDPTVRNRSKTSRVVDGGLRILKQPLGLSLYYMVTAWGGDRHTEQRLLGRVLQILYDDAILDGIELAGVLAGSPDQMHVSLAPLRLQDRAQVWWAIGQTYRLSVNYEVRIANIDAVREAAVAPVRERVIASGEGAS